MTKISRLLAGFLATLALGACGEGTPIAGSEPPVMSWGSIIAYPAAYFDSERSIWTTTAQEHAIAVIAHQAHDEPVHVSNLDIELEFGGGLLPDDLTDLKITDDTKGQVGITQSTVTATPPQFNQSNLNLIAEVGPVVNYEIIAAKFRAGARGTIRACLSGTGQESTSGKNMIVPRACGNEMTVTDK